MATKQEVIEMWGSTHNIKKKKGVDVNLKDLLDGQSVAYGDGKTYHWLLTKKDDDYPSILRCDCCGERKVNGRHLEFLSQINRDGNGTTPTPGDMSYLDDTLFSLQGLSLTNHTFIACGFNSFVVRMKSKK